MHGVGDNIIWRRSSGENNYFWDPPEEEDDEQGARVLTRAKASESSIAKSCSVCCITFWRCDLLLIQGHLTWSGIESATCNLLPRTNRLFTWTGRILLCSVRMVSVLHSSCSFPSNFMLMDGFRVDVALDPFDWPTTGANCCRVEIYLDRAFFFFFLGGGRGGLLQRHCRKYGEYAEQEMR